MESLLFSAMILALLTSQNMTKKQKIWFWIFLGMFLVPEILWSLVSNYLYSFLQQGDPPQLLRQNFLTSSDYRSYSILVVLIQFVGLLLACVNLFKNRKIWNVLSYYLFLLILIVLFLITFVVLYVLIATKNISF